MARRRAIAVRGEAPIIVALTALLTIVSLVPIGFAAAASLAVIALTMLAWRRRAPAATSLGVLFVACLALALAGLGPQQVVFAIAFTVYAVVLSRTPWLRGAVGWFRLGTLGRHLLALGAGFAALSAVALLAWYTIVRPDLSDIARTFVPPWPVWLLVPGAILFAVVNAALEEAAYRGVVLEALEMALGPGAAAVALQAVAFGALHFHGGFPRGALGVGLAFVYGLVLGWLRQKAGGLLAPWVTHVLTDLVIASIMLALVHR